MDPRLSCPVSSWSRLPRPRGDGPSPEYCTDDDDVEGDESLTLNDTVSDTAAGSVTLTIEDRTVITYTLSGPADPNIVEGRSYELTATASAAVETDTTVEILRDAAASDADADADDYSVEPIVIEAGETTRTTTLMVTDDDLPDGGTGTNRGETLVLFGSVDGVEIGDLTFIIWDAAVPALPVGGALLLSERSCSGAVRCGSVDGTDRSHAEPCSSRWIGKWPTPSRRRPPPGPERRAAGLRPGRRRPREPVHAAARRRPPSLVLRTCTVPAKPRWLLAIRGPRQCCPSPVRSHRAAWSAPRLVFPPGGSGARRGPRPPASAGASAWATAVPGSGRRRVRPAPPGRSLPLNRQTYTRYVVTTIRIPPAQRGAKL